jgi:putative hemolysin
MAIKKFIDIERIIASKNPGLVKKLPGFVLRYLKRILHQEEINTIIHENQHLRNQAFCSDIIKRFNITLDVRGLDNVPKDRGIILASNHPLGGMDAMALVDAFSGYRNDIRFIVNDILMNLENLKDLFVGVNKHGKNAKTSLQTVDRLFASDLAVFVFPAGLVSRQVKGEVRDLEWKKTFITRAKKNNKDVVPVHIDGGLSNFFYRLARWRERFGIKVNIEMLYLVNELFKQKNKTMTITFGKPIAASTFNATKNDLYWANWVKDEVYRLKG